MHYVKKCHFFAGKNGVLEENPMSPESEPSLMWLPHVKKIFFWSLLVEKNLLRHKIENNGEIFIIFKILLDNGFEMGNLKYYGILSHMHCFSVHHVKKSHFFGSQNGLLEKRTCLQKVNRG